MCAMDTITAEFEDVLHNQYRESLHRRVSESTSGWCDTGRVLLRSTGLSDIRRRYRRRLVVAIASGQAIA